MNRHAESLALEFDAANKEVIAFVETCTETQWTTLVEGEGWPVAVVMHHVAEGHRQMLGWIDHARHGEAITKTASEIDDDNARHARDCAHVTRADTVASLERHGGALARSIRDLSADELATSVSFGPAHGMAVTVGDLVPVAARHSRTHLAAARTALESGTT